MTAPSLLDDLEGVVRGIEGAPEHMDAAFIALQFIEARHAEIADMAKRLEAAERDAKRYRYLRRPEAWKESYIQRRGGISAIFVSDGHCGNAMDTEALDAAIDAAIAVTGNPATEQDQQLAATQEGEG